MRCEVFKSTFLNATQPQKFNSQAPEMASYNARAGLYEQLNKRNKLRYQIYPKRHE
jgi:hypothetical protein